MPAREKALRGYLCEGPQGSLSQAKVRAIASSRKDSPSDFDNSKLVGSTEDAEIPLDLLLGGYRVEQPNDSFLCGGL